MNKLKEAFEALLGQEHVTTTEESISLAEKTNYRTDQRIAAIIRPADAQQVKACMAVANEYKTPVYPVSRGKNWGYGSRVPVTSGNVLMELSRLNRILDFNEELGYVTIEPGVTFQQLFDFLRERKSSLIISGTGGSTDSSLIGNALERGIGTGLYADRFSSVCGLEIVLPDGSIISSGFKRYGENILGNVYKWGMGPSIDGLFSQSNFGVVTKATMWLMPCPEYLQLVFYKNRSGEKLPGLINALRGLAMSGLVRPALTVYNDFRVYSAMMQYPWKACTPGTNNSEDVRNVFRSIPGVSEIVGVWNGEVSIRSVTREHGKMQFDLISERLKDYTDQINYAEVSKEEIMQVLDDHYQGKFGGHDEDVIKSFLVRKYIGIPDNFPIRAAYWRKKSEIPAVMDPDADHCGMIWFSPLAPFDGVALQTAVNTISEIIDAHQFEPAISLQCLSERAINIITSISWDRAVEGEDERAEACYLALNQALYEKGFYPYRTTTLGMTRDFSEGLDDANAVFLNKIKAAIDPNNILAPGRYHVG